MKKLISIIALVAFFAVGLNAQDLSYSRVIKANKTINEFTGGAVDTLTSNQDSITISYDLDITNPFRYAGYIDIDTLASGATTIYVQGRRWDEMAWSNLDTVSFAHTADTAFEFTGITSDSYNRQMRLLFIRGSGSAEIQKVNMMIFNE